jgi:TetR/AcrR family transcriptional regulator, tetracycline repressor protein
LSSIRSNVQRVVQASLELLDQLGLDGLTMRQLADHLGVQAASLYRHVRDKQELLVLVADAVSGEIPLASAEPPWQLRLREAGHAYRRGLRVRRDAARLLASTAPVGPHRLRHIDALLSVLLSAHLAPRDAARAAYHFNNFVTEFAADEVRFAAAAEALGLSRAQLFEEARRRFRSMPPAEFPNLVRLADDLAADDPDELFDFGLELWVRGLEGLAGSQESSAGPAARGD